MIVQDTYQSVPDYSELREIRHHQASIVLAADGRQLGSYFTQNRTRIGIDDISSDFIDALIAVEDVRFHNHNGIDFRALARVSIKTILLRQDAGGGSTLTQQLVKNLYPRTGNGKLGLITDKLREMLTAVRLEKLYNKDEILELYLNTVSFGEETFGIETASHRFFNKPSLQLEPEEAALLAGLLRAPGYYNPNRHPERAENRRNTVIRQMEKYNFITPDQAEKYTDKPLHINYLKISTHEGMAPHFREHIRQELERLLNETPAANGKFYNLQTDGLIIQTTIDPAIQSAAEKALKKQVHALQDRFDAAYDRELLVDNHPFIRRAWQSSPHYRNLTELGKSDQEIEQIFHQPQSMTLFTWDGEVEKEISPHDSLKHYLTYLHAGMIALSPHTGEVKAWAGGIDHKYFQYDHVKSQRQSGSAFKPVVYAAALESGRKPCDYQRNLLNQYRAYEDWTPRNVREEYGGYYSLQAALSGSINTIAVDLLMDTGIDKIREKASKMGIDSNIPAEPSIALGTANVSLLELTQAYGVFASGGYRTKPYYIEAIYSSDGTLLYEFDNPNRSNQRERVLSEESAGGMIAMLSKAVDEGTGSQLRSQYGIEYALAGKTGTTQHYSDGWFIGITPDLVFGTWTGAWNPGIRFPNEMGYASQTALPIAGEFLVNISDNAAQESFASQFHDYQNSHNFSLICEDYRDDTFRDRVRDFITGRDNVEPRIVGSEDEDRGFRNRIRNFFGRN